MIIKKIFEEMTFLGGILFYILLSLLFLIIGKNNIFIQFILALFIIYFLTFIIRIFYFKNRPKKIHYKNFIEKLDASSFPSIHVARATFIILLIIFTFLPNFYLIFLLLILYGLVIYSRIYLLKHDLIDIIGGILLGFISSITLLLL